MALTKARVREILSEAGVDAEHMRDAVDKIVDGHVASVNALREEADNLRADAVKLPGVQKELDDLKAKVEADAKEREGKDYDALKAEYDKFKQETETEKQKAAVSAKYTEFLKDMNVSDAGIAKILKYASDGVELDESGKIANAKELRRSIKEEWPEYITETVTKGADTPTPPVSGIGTASGKTAADILAIKDDAEMVKAIEANPALFGLA